MYLGLGQVQADRLLGVPVRWIVARRSLLTSPGDPQYTPASGIVTGPSPQLVAKAKAVWGTSNVDALLAVASSMTEEEYNDLVTIDNFFGTTLPKLPGGDYSGQFFPTQYVGKPLEYLKYCIGLTAGVRPDPWKAHPLYCIKHFPGLNLPNWKYYYPPAVSRVVESIVNRLPYVPVSDNVFWKFDESRPWGQLKLPVQNAVIATYALDNYPWPSPAGYFKRFWVQSQLPKLRDFVNFDRPLLIDDVKTFVTMSMLEHFDSIAAMVEDFLEDKAKNAKRRALIKQVAGAVLGGMMAFALPIALATGFAAAMEVVNTADKVSAAKSMQNAALQFESSDMAFSQEINRVARELEESAARDASKSHLQKESEQTKAQMAASVASQQLQADNAMKLLPVGIAAAVLLLLSGG